MQNEGKHTAGPWHVENDDVIADEAGNAVARVYLPMFDPEAGAYNIDPSRKSDDGRVTRLKANARLIAAAPELLEAIKALRLQALQSNVNHPANEWGMEALALANAAIAKAEGKP